MSGGQVPYHLRPNKFVDREITVELLGLIQRYLPLGNHVYIGFGGHSLEDFKLVHMRLGTERMLSIESNSEVFSRQAFNLPFGWIRCRACRSGELIADLSTILAQYRFPADASIITWLDYAAAGEQNVQIREFQSLLQRAKHGDIVKLTLNANVNTFATRNPEENLEDLRTRQHEQIVNKLGGLVSGEISVHEISLEGFPLVLARAVERAVTDAFDGRDEIYQPLTIYRYADSAHQMMTICGIVLRDSEVDTFFEKTGLKKWRLGAFNFGECAQINVPALTLRERLFIEKLIPKNSSARVAKRLKFKFDNDASKNTAIVEQYRRFYRYYPHFHRVTY